jgi:hypothetical protein
MAHFAKIEDGKVTQVIVVNNEVIGNAEGLEGEALGAAFCSELFGGEWKQTSYNSNFRYNYAGEGYTYDSVRDAFIPPKPEQGNWELDKDTCLWIEVL